MNRTMGRSKYSKSFKGTGSKKILNNYLVIFLTNILSKISEKIVYSKMYNNINNYVRAFQARSPKSNGSLIICFY